MRGTTAGGGRRRRAAGARRAPAAGDGRQTRSHARARSAHGGARNRTRSANAGARRRSKTHRAPAVVRNPDFFAFANCPSAIDDGHISSSSQRQEAYTGGTHKGGEEDIVKKADLSFQETAKL